MQHPEKCSLCTILDDEDHAMHATSHRARVLHARINYVDTFFPCEMLYPRGKHCL